jgi:IclR family KDG regulon transcriptional repressor
MSKQRTGQNEDHGVRAVQRAIAILRAFSPSDSDLSVTDFSNKLNLHKSTVHRLLATLESESFVLRDPKNGRYRLGLPLLELGSLVTANLELRRVARPHLEDANSRCGETVHLGILDQGEVVYIDKIDSTRRLRMHSQVGGRAPAHCTGLGKVLLAALPAVELDQVMQQRGLRSYTDRTLTSPEALRDHLAVVRQQGYAVDSGENEELVHCAAAPIIDHTGGVVAAVSIATVGVDVESRRFKEYIELVLKAAQNISEDLGHGHAALLSDGRPRKLSDR